MHGGISVFCGRVILCNYIKHNSPVVPHYLAVVDGDLVDNEPAVMSLVQFALNIYKALVIPIFEANGSNVPLRRLSKLSAIARVWG